MRKTSDRSGFSNFVIPLSDRTSIVKLRYSMILILIHKAIQLPLLISLLI